MTDDLELPDREQRKIMEERNSKEEKERTKKTSRKYLMDNKLI